MIKLQNEIKNNQERLILNEKLSETEIHSKINGYGHVYMKAAQNRYMRFMPFLAESFPETAARKGIIESELYDISDFAKEINSSFEGKLFLKDDAHLTVGHSVTSRGTMHEVMHITENLLQKNKLLAPTENYSKLNSSEIREFLSNYEIHAVELENLSMSAGILAAKLGFKTIIHLSKDECDEKKNYLINQGIKIEEYDSDYSTAVNETNSYCENKDNRFFIGNNDSKDNFFGYSVAALRLKVQLNKAHVLVDENHPLFVYIPSPIPEAACGIAFGLKQLMGNDVHCFFVDKTYTSSLNEASSFVKSMSESIISGTFTVSGKSTIDYFKKLRLNKNITLRPTSCMGFKAIEAFKDTGLQSYLEKHNLSDKLENSAHIVWAVFGETSEQALSDKIEDEYDLVVAEEGYREFEESGKKSTYIKDFWRELDF